MIGDFHFLQPLWLLALAPLVLLLWRLSGRYAGGDAWRKICDAHLLPHLLIDSAATNRRLPLWLLAIGWFITVLALANPVWEKHARPVFRAQDARVIVLDLSASMRTPDVTPSRLIQARYKVAEALKRSTEGQTGLVVFAADAFVVSPLTEDVETITAQLQALTPDIMPVQGSRADLGLRQAGQLLEQAGAERGEILLIGDGFAKTTGLQAAADLRAQGYTVNVLAVGTEEGAPLPSEFGGFVRDPGGNIVVPRLNADALRTLARTGGGRYALISPTDSDLEQLLGDTTPHLGDRADATTFTAQWRERGPWLVLLLLPLAVLAFRRGWLLSLLLMSSTMPVPEEALAFGWDDLWQRQEQQAAEALANNDPARAAALAEDPARRGAAYYEQGDYAEALASFAQAPGADADYNKGNALARMGRYQDAVAAYDKALSQQSDMEDARHNKALIEALLQQQRNRQQAQSETRSAQQEPSPNDPPQPDPGEPPDPREHPRNGKEQREQQQSTSGKSDPESGRGEQESNQDAEGSGSGQGQATGADSGSRGKEQGGSTPGGADTGTHPPSEKVASPANADPASLARQEDQEKSVEKPENERPGQTARQSPPVESAPGATTDEPVDRMGQSRQGTPGQAAVESLPTEEQQALEQWLRRIPDDPGGLLRRKFLYQYRQRRQSADAGDHQPW